MVLLGPTENLHRHIDSDVKMKSIKPGKAIIVAQSTEGQKHKHLIKTKKKTTLCGTCRRAGATVILVPFKAWK